jgi:TatD DNase family protein
MICVGTSVEDSNLAVDFVQSRPECWVSVGVHPHESLRDKQKLDELKALAKKSKVVAVGECGLDYFYKNAPKEDQVVALKLQLELALECNLPIIFHVREAFDDFWPIFDSYQGIRGVLHSFTDNAENLQKAMDRGLYIGINGIMTFTKQDWQLENLKAIPADRMLLETDAPFLTPVPHRGKVNEPALLKHVAEFVAQLRGESLDQLAEATTLNATTLFSVR